VHSVRIVVTVDRQQIAKVDITQEAIHIRMFEHITWAHLDDLYSALLLLSLSHFHLHSPVNAPMTSIQCVEICTTHHAHAGQSLGTARCQ
jgi:hypothetical protein